MESNQNIIKLIKSLEILEDNMKLIYTNTDGVWRFCSYKQFMVKYNDIAKKAISYIKNNEEMLFDIFNVDVVPSPFDTIDMQQQNLFNQVFFNVGILKVTLQNLIDFNENETLLLKNFLNDKLRCAMINEPNCEKDVQDVIEQLFIGNGKIKDIDYGREVGRVKLSSKEVIPDFVFYKLNLAIEVKYCDSKTKAKSIISQISDDIHAYSLKYKNILFVIYDKGFIRDTEEFKHGLENSNNIIVTIIKQ